MNLRNDGDAHITVIPYCPHCGDNYRNEITIQRLHFWYNNKINHPVNDESIKQFLLHVNLFGASVYPDFPELGCHAIDGDKSFSPAGKTGVSQILYKGEVIYCRS